MLYRLKTAGAGHFYLALIFCPEPDVRNYFPGATVLFDQLGPSGYSHGSNLPDFFAVVDVPGGKRYIKFEGFPLKIGDGNQHGNPRDSGERALPPAFVRRSFYFNYLETLFCTEIVCFQLLTFRNAQERLFSQLYKIIIRNRSESLLR